MEQHRKLHSVEKMAKVLGVTRSGYYAWCKSKLRNGDPEEKKLVKVIKEIQEIVKFRYGSPRMTRALRRRGICIGHKKVSRLLKEYGLGARRRRKYKSTTNSNPDHPVAPNLVNRIFDVAEPNKVWVSDITYIPTAEGWLYLCVIIDLYSRKIVGWAMDKRVKADIVMNAMVMAMMNRKPPVGLIFHSDRGSQYCSKKVMRIIEKSKMTQSMSRKGNCFDNAVAESFFKTLKGELFGHRAFSNRYEARVGIFEYLEVFYNRVRLHSSIGYLSPEEYERENMKKTA
jgi:transposase InsO family protein